MRPHPRIRRIAKWTGICLCVLILAAWGVSLRWYVWWGDYCWVRLQHGYVCFGWYLCSRAEFDRARASPAVSYLLGQPTLRIEYCGTTPPASWSYSWGYGIGLPVVAETGATGASYCREVFIPLWIPLLLIATPTAFALRRARPPPPGHCRTCGYNLTGNISGVCPECGASCTPQPPGADLRAG